MRHLAAAVVLATVLSGTAWAGEIPLGDQTPAQCTSTTPGEIPTSDAPAPGVSTLITIILTLLTTGR
jgi:hypothetical protein